MSKLSLPGLTRQSITLRKIPHEKMDARVKPAHDGLLRRRDLIGLLAGAATTPLLRPLAARAQQRLPVVGWLSTRGADSDKYLVAAFHRGLSESGFVEGRNVTIEYRWSGEQRDLLTALATDLIRRQVDVIVVNGVPGTQAAKAATTTIPIVFQMGADPVGAGLVASLSRPGGNLTGVVSLGVELGPKRLALLRELVPTAASMALLLNAGNPTIAETERRDMEAAARTFGLKLHVLYVRTERDFEPAFETMLQQQAGGLVISNSGIFNVRSEELAALALRYRVPTAFQYPEFTAVGGLLSYGGSLTDNYRLAGVYAGRIIKGEKPAELPVQQSTKIELTINLKTAKALGLTVPLSLLGRADEVIE